MRESRFFTIIIFIAFFILGSYIFGLIFNSIWSIVCSLAITGAAITLQATLNKSRLIKYTFMGILYCAAIIYVFLGIIMFIDITGAVPITSNQLQQFMSPDVATIMGTAMGFFATGALLLTLPQKIIVNKVEESVTNDKLQVELEAIQAKLVKIEKSLALFNNNSHARGAIENNKSGRRKKR